MTRLFNLFVLLLCLHFFVLPTTLSAQNAEAGSMPEPDKAPIATMVGQMIMTGFNGKNFEENAIIDQIHDLNLGGVVLFEKSPKNAYVKNISPLPEMKANVKFLHSAARYPLIVATDQEGGYVQRFNKNNGYISTPSAKQMGKGSAVETQKRSAAMGKELNQIINLDFAPCVDVDVNPKSPAIGKLERSFSSNPAVVTAHARAFIAGLKENGIASCLKHFPGHGSAGEDTHAQLANITDTWQKETELYPYKKLISENKAPMIMVGHLFNKNIDATYPASLSNATITGLLRNNLGFKGVVITDDLQMKAITNSYTLEETILLTINAGTDVLLFGNNITYDPQIAQKVYNIIIKLVKEKKITRKRLEESYARIKYFKENNL